MRVYFFMRKYEKHGMKGKSIYMTWSNMKMRCYNKNFKQYKDWGGRGITVCDEWKDSFIAFYNDMGDKPDKNYSLDRIDNDKGYCKDNCRWTNRVEQSRNTRTSNRNTSGFKGVNWFEGRKKWQVRISINKKSKHIGLYSSYEDAVKARKDAELKYWT